MAHKKDMSNIRSVVKKTILPKQVYKKLKVIIENNRIVITLKFLLIGLFPLEVFSSHGNIQESCNVGTVILYGTFLLGLFIIIHKTINTKKFLYPAMIFWHSMFWVLSIILVIIIFFPFSIKNSVGIFIIGLILGRIGYQINKLYTYHHIEHHPMLILTPTLLFFMYYLFITDMVSLPYIIMGCYLVIAYGIIKLFYIQTQGT